MSKMRGAILIDTDRCKGCALCIAACPLGLLKVAERKVNRKGYPYVVQQGEERCTGCTACGVVCPDGCITIYRTKTDNP